MEVTIITYSYFILIQEAEIIMQEMRKYFDNLNPI